MPNAANITAAALVMQFCIVGILILGAFWVSNFYGDCGNCTGVSLLFALLTLGSLLFTDQFSALWRPLSGSVDFAFFSWGHTLLTIFILDILWIGYLIHFTGGSDGSPFTPVYFILPAMAFLLRESTRRVIVYTVLIGVAFAFGFLAPGRDPRQAYKPRGTYLLISIACLVLSVIIGVMTRPIR